MEALLYACFFFNDTATTEIYTRLLTNGFRIVYEPAAFVRHRHRRSWAEVHETIEGYGTGVYATWTGALVKNREWSALAQAWRWLRYGQAVEFMRTVRRRHRRVPWSVLAAEYRGCLAGPSA